MPSSRGAGHDADELVTEISELGGISLFRLLLEVE